jgi:hypothetical protein
MNKLLMVITLVAILSPVVPVSVNANHPNIDNLPVCDNSNSNMITPCWDSKDHDECIPISNCPE